MVSNMLSKKNRNPRTAETHGSGMENRIAGSMNSCENMPAILFSCVEMKT